MKKTTKKESTIKTVMSTVKPLAIPSDDQFDELKLTTYNNTWDFEKFPSIIGKVIDMKEITIPAKKKQPEQITNILEVQTTEGIFNVWASACLEPLFEMKPIGKIVKIVYIETVKIKGGNKFKKFQVFIARS